MIKKENKTIFYIFLILFFGWMIAELAWLEKDYFPNQVTGFQVFDPVQGLTDLLSKDVGIGGQSFPLGASLVAILIIFAVITVFAGRLNFFEGEGRRGYLFLFSIGVSVLTAFYTPVVSWIFGLSAYLGFFLPVLIFVLLIISAYLFFHRNVREEIRETFPGGTGIGRFFGGLGRGAGRGAGRVVGGGRAAIITRLVNTYFDPIRNNALQIANEIRSNPTGNPNSGTIKGHLNTILRAANDLGNEIRASTLTGPNVTISVNLTTQIINRVGPMIGRNYRAMINFRAAFVPLQNDINNLDTPLRNL